ncbi:MAG: hypothetical protein GY940_11735, partial [bacterium]|nr:hypothetical protein [bacterium]
MEPVKRLDKKDIEDVLALTPMQEGMFYHYLKEPAGGYYFEQLNLRISGPLDVNCFERAWNVVIETNEMLRTVFRWEKLKSPTQVVLKQHTLQLRNYDLTAGENRKAGKKLEEIKRNDRNKTFNLREVPFRVTLCKLEEDKFEVIISNHHIIY